MGNDIYFLLWSNPVKLNWRPAVQLSFPLRRVFSCYWMEGSDEPTGAMGARPFINRSGHFVNLKFCRVGNEVKIFDQLSQILSSKKYSAKSLKFESQFERILCDGGVRWCQLVWPDLAAKFCHLGKKSKSWALLDGLFIFGKILNLLWQ